MHQVTHMLSVIYYDCIIILICQFTNKDTAQKNQKSIRTFTIAQLNSPHKYAKKQSQEEYQTLPQYDNA